MLGEYAATPTIAVSDLARARDFYENVLGLTVEHETPEAGVVIYKSGNGRVQVYQSSSAGSNKATYATWQVPDIAACVEGLKSKGVAFEHYPDMPGVSLEGDVHVWDGEKAAWFKDPDGNILCIDQG
jgi:catechol 2,3-dioxygenase-like lactoylglutathione lyase family enzyme